jgi:hypothetical protein
MQEIGLAKKAPDVGEIGCQFPTSPGHPAGLKSPWFQPGAFAFDG